MIIRGVLVYILYRSVLCVIIYRNFFMYGKFLIIIFEGWIICFYFRIEVDDRIEVYLRVL